MAKKSGRPTDYTADLGDLISDRVASGESLNKICKDDDMPSRDTVYRWLRLHGEFSDNYARAREERAHARFEKIDEVIQDMRDKTIDHNQARVEIDAIKWQTGKESPRHYGDKHVIQHEGIEKLTDEELDGKLTELLAKAGIDAAVVGEGETEEPE